MVAIEHVLLPSRTGSITLRGFIFFFQAEDGIRDRDVTGVQTLCSSDLEVGKGQLGDTLVT